jgi:protein TonB
MLGVLLESKARKQRRTAGATMSVALHVAIIGAAVVSTAQGTMAPRKPEKIVTVHIAPPPQPREARHEARTTSTVSTTAIPSNIVIKHVDAPTIVPTNLPPIDMTGGLAADSIAIGGGTGQTTSYGDRVGGETTTDSRDWDVREVLMHIVAKTPPRYPESLRSAGVDGHVLVEFTVDTTGRVDVGHMRVVESTHELFTRAVRDALGGFRFLPAQAGGRRVPALARMPFEFHITR